MRRYGGLAPINDHSSIEEMAKEVRTYYMTVKATEKS